MFFKYWDELSIILTKFIIFETYFSPKSEPLVCPFRRTFVN